MNQMVICQTITRVIASARKEKAMYPLGVYGESHLPALYRKEDGRDLEVGRWQDDFVVAGTGYTNA